MKATIKASKIHGSVEAPPSKSMAHRYLIAAGLAEGESIVRNIAMSEDIKATINCLRALGATIIEIPEKDNNNSSRSSLDLSIRGADPRTADSALLNCNESGSSLRFMIPVAALSDKEMTFTGTDKLLSRPLFVYEEIFRNQGLHLEREDKCIRLKGRLNGGEFETAGDISSQFISGLLIALPLSDKDSIIKLSGAIESRPYIDMTMDALKSFGIRSEWKGSRTISVPGAQKYSPSDVTTEGDWSNAAYLMALGAEVYGVDDNSLQGDKVCKTHFGMLDRGFAEIDISDCPDLGPALMAYAAMREGCMLHGTGRLKIKESDRGSAMQAELSKFGVNADISENSIRVYSGINTPEEMLFGHNDHRIVMALAAVCLKTGGVIEGAEAVNKSFPDFFDAIRTVGAEFTIEE